MKKRVLFVVLAGALVGAPLLAAGSEVGPETIDMKAEFKVEGAKQAVIFPHRQHQAKLACGKCHQSPQGGGDLIVEFVNKSGAANDFHKKFCWPCHTEMNVPKGKSCSTCHK